jgi:hypothetical protein
MAIFETVFGCLFVFCFFGKPCLSHTVYLDIEWKKNTTLSVQFQKSNIKIVERGKNDTPLSHKNNLLQILIINGTPLEVIGCQLQC